MKTKQNHINFWVEQANDDWSEFMLYLNRFQLERRYPDYLTKMHKICNKQFTKDTLDTTNNLRLWLIEKLQ